MESIVCYAICFLFLIPHIYLQKTVHCAAAAYDTVILLFLLTFGCWWCILPWKYQRGHCTLNTIIANFILTMQLIKTILLYNKILQFPVMFAHLIPTKFIHILDANIIHICQIRKSKHWLWCGILIQSLKGIYEAHYKNFVQKLLIQKLSKAWKCSRSCSL